MNKEHSCHLVSQFYSQHSSLAGLLLAVKVVILRVPAAGNKLPLEHAFHFRRWSAWWPINPARCLAQHRGRLSEPYIHWPFRKKQTNIHWPPVYSKETGHGFPPTAMIQLHLYSFISFLFTVYMEWSDGRFLSIYCIHGGGLMDACGRMRRFGPKRCQAGSALALQLPLRHACDHIIKYFVS
jgi:hypothetical protein